MFMPSSRLLIAAYQWQESKLTYVGYNFAPNVRIQVQL